MTATRPILLSVAAAFFIAFSVMLIQQGLLVFGPLLMLDDTFFIGRALFDMPVIPASHPTIYLALAKLAPILPIWALKTLSVMWFGGLAAVITAWLMLTGVRSTAAITSSLLIALYPLAIDQGIFIAGSHALIGTTLLLLAAVSIRATIERSAAAATIGILSAGVFVMAARLTSPSLFLAPVVPLILVLALARALGLPRGISITYAALALIPLLGGILLGAGYHYSGIVGWVSFDGWTILSNVGSAIRLVIRPLVSPVNLALAVTLGALATFAVWRNAPPKAAFYVSLPIIIAAALAFGPSAVTTSYIDRYAFAPFVLVAVALAGPISAGISMAPLPWRAVALVSSAGLFFSLQPASLMQRLEHFEPYVSAALAVERIVATDARGWPTNAQIVVLTDRPLAPPTAGLAHWSTWYLRTLSGRSDVTALIGPRNMLDTKPWVVTYSDSDPIYWEVVNGRSRRMPMRGLVPERPLIAYASDGSGHFDCASAVVFIENDVETRVLPGRALSGQGSWSRQCAGDQIPWRTSTPSI